MDFMYSFTGSIPPKGSLDWLKRALALVAKGDWEAVQWALKSRFGEDPSHE